MFKSEDRRIVSVYKGIFLILIFSFGKIMNEVFRSPSRPPESGWPQKKFSSLRGGTAVVWGECTLSECNNDNTSHWEKNKVISLRFWKWARFSTHFSLCSMFEINWADWQSWVRCCTVKLHLPQLISITLSSTVTSKDQTSHCTPSLSYLHSQRPDDTSRLDWT